MNMKKILLGVALSVLTSVIYAQSTPKMAVVNVNEVLAGYVVYQSVSEDLTQKRTALEDMKKAADEMLKEEQQPIIELQKKLENPALTESAKADIESEARELLGKLQQKAQAEQQTLIKEENSIREWQNKKMSGIQADLTDAIDAICAERGFDLVISHAATLYVSDSLDITADVRQRLNAKVAATAAGASGN
jgi:Skp family chaperone for outer membrane proteins